MLEKTCQPVHHFFVLEKQQTIKKEEKKKRKEKPKNRENKKSGLWFINYQNLIHQKKGKNSLVLVY